MKQLTIFGQNEHLLVELLAQGVRFLVVGGLAVHFHNPARRALGIDLDLLIEPTPENAKRLFRAFLALRLTPHFGEELIAEPTERPQQLPIDSVFYADIITTGRDIDFTAEWGQASEGLIFQNLVRFASKDLLIRMKRKAGREKDLLDITLLENAPLTPVPNDSRPL